MQPVSWCEIEEAGRASFFETVPVPKIRLAYIAGTTSRLRIAGEGPLPDAHSTRHWAPDGSKVAYAKRNQQRVDVVLEAHDLAAGRTGVVLAEQSSNSKFLLGAGRAHPVFAAGRPPLDATSNL